MCRVHSLSTLVVWCLWISLSCIKFLLYRIINCHDSWQTVDKRWFLFFVLFRDCHLLTLQSVYDWIFLSTVKVDNFHCPWHFSLSMTFFIVHDFFHCPWHFSLSLTLYFCHLLHRLSRLLFWFWFWFWCNFVCNDVCALSKHYNPSLW